MTLLQNIQHLAGNAQSELIRLRRHLHAWPELSFQEHQTARFIADTLQSLGIEYSTGWGGTGIVAVIR
ncbi:MAG TPA: amidohydrolase, partial [Saprospiraceae bacterium]|nr:amidohydrolase [Saprospiraceae bacterium]